MKNFKTKLFAAAMAAPLALSGISVFADGNEPDVPSVPVATEGQQSNTAPTIKNEFTMPEGTTTPNVTFTYKIEKAAGDTGDFEYPELTNPSITYTATTDNLTQTVKLFNDSDFTSAGIYEYNVSQVYRPMPLDSIDGFDQVLNADQTTYTVRVYVKNGEAGLEYTYTVENDNKKQDFGTDGPVLTFNNNYFKTKLDETNGVFTLGQTVTGDLGDKNRDFEYTISLTAPENAGENPFAGTIGTENVVNDVTNQTIKMTGNQPDMIKLTKAPVGSTIVITATNAGDHTTTFKKGDDALTTGDTKTYTYKVTEDGLQLIVNQNKDMGDNPITGNMINNLPFLGLIAVALGGFVAFIALKRRQNA